jgi:hypothetical protein
MKEKCVICHKLRKIYYDGECKKCYDTYDEQLETFFAGMLSCAAIFLMVCNSQEAKK